MAWDKVAQGQSLNQTPVHKAGFINDTIDVIADYQSRRLGDPLFNSGLKYPTDLVKIQNTTGDDLDRGSVVQLGDDVLDDKDFRRLWFECNLPADPLMRRYAILLAPVLADDIGMAQVSGCCLARVNVGSVLHTHAMPADDSDELVSCFGGPIELLSDPDGTGSQQIAVRLAVGFGLLFGKADSGGISARSGTTLGSGTMSIWQPDTSGVLTDSTVNHTAYNFTTAALPENMFALLQRESRNGLLIVTTPDMTMVARFIEFTLPSALATSDASKASCPVVAYWGGYDPGSTVTVYNYADVAGGYQWEGDNGAHGYAVWDDELERYRIIDLNCPAS